MNKVKEIIKNLEKIRDNKGNKYVIDSKSPIYNYEFAFHVPDADIKRHGAVVIKSKDPKYNYLFAMNIEEANVVEHRKVLLSTNDEGMKQDFLSDELLNERYENSIIKNKILSLRKGN